ncbi:hypothetical protein AB4562_06810 [Vibrio sp. 10N.222.54.A1]|uniref:hypothetical protein n=1 Tax=unclassified Vibrio TaxID=2614977 RepID=UPI003550C868
MKSTPKTLKESELQKIVHNLDNIALNFCYQATVLQADLSSFSDPVDPITINRILREQFQPFFTCEFKDGRWQSQKKKSKLILSKIGYRDQGSHEKNWDQFCTLVMRQIGHWCRTGGYLNKKIKPIAIPVEPKAPLIGMGIEPTFKAKRVLAKNVVIDAVTTPKAQPERSILYAAGWTVDGAFTKK